MMDDEVMFDKSLFISWFLKSRDQSVLDLCTRKQIRAKRAYAFCCCFVIVFVYVLFACLFVLAVSVAVIVEEKQLWFKPF